MAKLSMLHGFTKRGSVDVLHLQKMTFLNTIRLTCNPTLHAIRV